MKILAVMTCLLFVVGCSKDGGTSAKAEYGTAADIQSALSDKGVTCTNLTTGEEMLTRENATCDLSEDETLDLLTFSSADQQSQYLKIAVNSGGVYVKGDLGQWGPTPGQPLRRYRRRSVAPSSKAKAGHPKAARYKKVEF